jgi:hypothetical protein
MVRILPYVADLRSSLAPLRGMVPDVLLFSLPDALWVYSATASMILAWRRSSAFGARCWQRVPLVLAVGAELGQWLRLVPGTFDIRDVVLIAAASTLASILLENV